MLAIIPARGGSKGLPDKNIKLFNGKPLIAYTIEAALKAAMIDRIIVSTDCERIAAIARDHGAEVPFMRPDELALDQSSQWDVMVYTLERLQKEKGVFYDDFMILQPTSPLRKSTHIDEAFELFRSRKARALISVTESAHPIEWTKCISEQGELVNYFNDIPIGNRQKYQKTYMPNGMIYIYESRYFIEAKTGHGNGAVPYIVDKKYADDIDDLQDFQVAEMKYRLYCEEA